jgi:hypothetical protein
MCYMKCTLLHNYTAIRLDSTLPTSTRPDTQTSVSARENPYLVALNKECHERDPCRPYAKLQLSFTIVSVSNRFVKNFFIENVRKYTTSHQITGQSTLRGKINHQT